MGWRSCYLCNKKKQDNRVVLHRFPKDDWLRKKWLSACCLNENDDVTYITICSNHFLLDDYKKLISSRRKLLNENAVPSLFVPNPPKPDGTLLDSSSNSGNEISITLSEGRTEYLPSNSRTIQNKENRTISEGLAKLVAEPGRIPTLHLKPVQTFQRNESETPSIASDHKKNTEICNTPCEAKAGSEVNTWDIEEETYTVVLCAADDSNEQQEEDPIIERVCRTCLKVFSVKDTILVDNGTKNIQRNCKTLKEKLLFIQPDIDFDLTEKPVVVCKTCERNINLSYEFVHLCKSSEIRLKKVTGVNKRPILDSEIKDLPPASETIESILRELLTHPPTADENKSIEIIECGLNDNIIEDGARAEIIDVITDEVVTNEVITEVITNDVTSEVIINDVITEVITSDVITNEVISNEVITNEVISNEVITNEVISNEVITNDVITNEVTTNNITTDKLALKNNITKRIPKKVKEINSTDLVNEELNLSDVDDAWEWDTIRCDPLKPNPNRTHPSLKDHIYATETRHKKSLPKNVQKWREKFSKKLDILSEEFGDYLRRREGNKPDVRIIRRLNACKKPVNGEPPFVCEFCGLIYQTFGTYQIHIKIKHGKAKKRICPVCGKSVFEPYFRQHSQHHSMKRKTSVHICHKCGKCFTGLSNLANHMKIHEVREKKFQCPVCGNIYYTRYQLMLHQRSHGERQFKCKYCMMSFYYAATLKRHMAHKHEMKAALQCHICNKVLKFKTSFKAHMNAHVNNNKYKCDLCPESFRKKIPFETHKNKIHLNISFKCKYCKRKYYTQFLLNKHLEDVHGEKLYSNFRCYMCQRTYIREEFYKQHLITTHGISVEEVDDHIQMFSIDNEETIEYVQVNCEKKERNYQEIEKEDDHATEESCDVKAIFVLEEESVSS